MRTHNIRFVENQEKYPRIITNSLTTPLPVLLPFPSCRWFTFIDVMSRCALWRWLWTPTPYIGTLASLNNFAWSFKAWNVQFIWPQRQKTNLRTCAVWSESLLGSFWIVKDAKFFHADNEDSNQIMRMRWLIWVIVGCTFQRVCFFHVASHVYPSQSRGRFSCVLLKKQLCTLNKKCCYLWKYIT